MPAITTTDDIRLAYEQHRPQGGAHVVLLAGFRAPGSSWHNQMPAFVTAGYRVTVLDLRGHGAADPSPEGTTMATRASDLDALLRHLQITDAVLIGGSMGASTIWAYVQGFGEERVRAVVSIDQTPRMLNGEGDEGDEGGDSGEGERRVDGRVAGGPWEHGFYGYTAANRDTFFAETIPPTGVSTPMWRRPVRVGRMLRAMQGGSRELGPGDTSVLHDHAKADWRPVIAGFSKPVLFVAGAESEFWPAAHAAASAALAPRGSSAIVLRAGHAANMEQPKAINAGLLAFLRAAGAGVGAGAGAAPTMPAIREAKAASVQMRLLAVLLRLTYKRRFATAAAGRAGLARPKRSSHPPAWLRKRCDVRSTRVGGFDVHAVRARDARDAPGEGPAVVYLHGGAYCNEIVSQHWSLVADLAEQTRCEVLVPIYGLAPQHNGLEALDFVTQVLERLGARGRPVHLIGDSAGGGLALIAAQAAAGHATIRIVGATLIAPWLDLTMENPGVDAVEPTDPWLTRAGLRPIAAAWADGTDLRDPRLSPIFGDMSGLPPVEIWVGTRDITLPDSRLLRDRLGSSLAGFHELAGGVHVVPLLPVPEGRASRRAIIEHARRRLTEAR